MKGGRWALVCPKCKNEFAYDDDALLAEREVIAERIRQLQGQIAQAKAQSVYSKQDRDYKSKIVNQLGMQLSECHEQIANINRVRHQARNAVEEKRVREFINLIKEEYGEREYKRLWDKVDESFRPSSITELMKHSYSCGRQDATGINKL